MMEQINDTTFEITLSGGDKVEIGDKESTDFKPHIKLNRWAGECFIAIQPAGEIEEEVEYEVEGDKIKCKYKVKQDDLEFEWETEFYPLEPRTVIAKDKDGNDTPHKQCELGGFEFEIILKEKPETNKIILSIETQGLEFHYQHGLTQEDIDKGCVGPDNVIGSYAVYHATRGQVHKSKEVAEKYKAGKAFHIYRPKITDANGDWVWGGLHLDEQAGTLTTTIPQDFLDNAVYPISTGTSNFGYTTLGDYDVSGANLRVGAKYNCPEAGAGISISWGNDWSFSAQHVKCCLYDVSGNKVANGETEEETSGGYNAWVVHDFLAAPTLANADYWLFWWTDSFWPEFQYDELSGSYISATEAYGAWPGSIDVGTPSFGRRYSIYCTYGEVAPPEAEGGAQYARVSHLGVLVIRG